MLKKHFVTGLATFLLTGFLLIPVGSAVAEAAAIPASTLSEKMTSSSQTGHPGSTRHCKCFVGGDHMAFVLLSDLLKKSSKDLKAQYPQQTPWQIAKQTNQLEALKKVYLEKQQQHIQSMQEHGYLAQADGTQLFELLSSRVAKVDGVKIVTIGHVCLS